MELKQKGENTSIDVSKPLTVTITWTTAADFDLAAVYETNEGKPGIVYFGDKGQLNEFPYISLSEDQGVGDTGGDNEEKMRINQLNDMKYVWIFCWDYGMVQKGQRARFENSDIKLTVTDDAGNHTSVKVDTGDSGNVCCIATLDNTNPEAAKFINYSQVATLQGLQNLEQLLMVVRQFIL